MLSQNIIIKDWRKIDLSFGLIYPNTYRIGMSSYSIRLLYNIINSYENIACELIFLPEDIKISFPASTDHSSNNNLRSIENGVLPSDFDILGFSIHYENDLKNILWILEKAEIPLTFHERHKRSKNSIMDLPLIIGGGPVITSNPIVFSKFFDFLFIGDSESNLPQFFELFLKLKKKNIIYNDFLEKIKKIEGIFIPKLQNKTQRAILENIDDSPNPTFQLISRTSKKKIFEENFFVEINRGCPYSCKFCLSSFHNFPFRNRTEQNIKQIIDEGIKKTDVEVISLIGSCVSSHPKFKEICEFIIEHDKRISLPSVRIEHLNEDLIRILEKGNIKTITLAPETGSENLRYSLGKKISNKKIISILTLIKKSKIKNVKLYFLIGLPNETVDNIYDIIELIKNIANLGFEKKTIRININPFIPKLNTPYEKEINLYLEKNINELLEKYQLLEKELKNNVSLKLNFKNFKIILKNARFQTLISLGNKKISDILLKYYYNGANFTSLKKIERELNFSLDEYLIKIRNCYSPWTMQ